MTLSEPIPPLSRFPSGVPGFDRITGGGLFAGGVYIVEGVPGAGKTIFANQLCFRQVKDGKRVLYVTLLAESHARLIQHMQGLRFFDLGAVPDRLTYVSGFRALEEGGLRGLLDMVRQELRTQGAAFVVLDGFAAVGETAASDRDFKKFVHELQIHAGLSSCTFLLLSSGMSVDPAKVQPVHTMVDGLVRLSDHTFGVRAVREVCVAKLRGTRYLRGIHTFDISDDGIRVHPRLESFSADLADSGSGERLSMGVPALDAVVGGGLVEGSTTMLLGPTGVGKTMLGYRFVGEADAREKGVLVSFYETPKSALAKADGIGLDLARSCKRGTLEIVWQSPVETTLDLIGGAILEAVDRSNARRLFIDGFNALEHATAYPERVPMFFAALGRELRARAVTTLYSAELREIFSSQTAAPYPGLSPLLENLLLLRFVERRGELRRAISVIKLRDSGFDPRLRELTVSEAGIRIGEGFGDAEAVMAGAANERPAPEPTGRANRPSKRSRAAKAPKRASRRG